MNLWKGMTTDNERETQKDLLVACCTGGGNSSGGIAKDIYWHG